MSSVDTVYSFLPAFCPTATQAGGSRFRLPFKCSISKSAHCCPMYAHSTRFICGLCGLPRTKYDTDLCSYANNPHACTSTAPLISSHWASSTSTYTFDDVAHLTSIIPKTTDEGGDWHRTRSTSPTQRPCARAAGTHSAIARTFHPSTTLAPSPSASLRVTVTSHCLAYRQFC